MYTQLEKLLKKDEYLLRNLLIPFKSGFKDEIEAVLISHKGVIAISYFPIWSEGIRGNDDDLVWLTAPKGGLAKSIPNPVLQNKLHAENIEQALKHKWKVLNVVILQGTLTPEDIHSSHAYCFADFSTIYEEREDTLSTEEIKNIKEILGIFAK